jgi:diguanylate cyclase (GGDEF)-like protein
VTTVLVVEDSDAQRARLTRLLTESGLCEHVVEARDGISGLRMLQSSQPDLVLCDVEMPGIGGEKLLALATSEPMRRTPVLMLTAVPQPALRTALLQRGARDVIAKSVDPGEIIARVGLHLELARLQRELSERNAQLEELSTTDALTQLRNRRFLDQAIPLEWQRSRRLGTPFTILIADVDHFKQINDTHGHPTGDRVLAGIGKVLGQRVRGTDVVGRWGGEEFLAIVASPLEGGLVLGEYLRRDVESLRIPSEHGAPVAPTVSIGVASRAPNVESPDEVVSSADHALFAAKAAGRNRVHTLQRGSPARRERAPRSQRPQPPRH